MKKIKSLIFLCFSLTLFFMFNIEAEALESGNYIITSSLNNNKVVDLAAAKTKNGSNIQLYDRNNTDAQTWHFEKMEDGYYTISSVIDNNYVLDVYGASFKNYSNIQLYKSNNSKAQKWKLLEDEKGYFTILSYDESYALDVYSGNTYNGTNVQLYQSNFTTSQKFAINKVVSGDKVINDGIYTISSYDDNYIFNINNSLIQNGSNINLSSNNNKASQKWYVKYLNNGYYSIRSLTNQNFSLDVTAAGKLRNTNIQLYSWNGSEAQEWVIRDNGDGIYSIISRINGLAVDIENQVAANSSNVLLSDDDGRESEKLKFNRIENFGEQSIQDGYYFINTRLNTNKSLDVASGKMVDNSNVQLYDSNSTSAQKWHIKYIGDGYYSILCDKDESYALTSENTDISNVRINKFNNLDTQKWIIKDNGDGYYSIFTKNYLKVDVDNASTPNGTNIKLYTSNNSNAQQFKFIPTANGIASQVLENGYYFINSALDENYVVDLAAGKINNNTNIQLYSLNSTKAQKWYLTYIDNGYYKITSSVSSFKTLDVYAGRTIDGTNVQLFDYNGSYAQQWIIKDAGDGYFYIVSNCNGLYLDVNNQAASNGANIEVNSYTGSQAQKFKFTKTRLENLVIDVSEYNGEIDWPIVKNSAGIYGTIIRISEGCEKEDVKLAKNVAEVKRLGIPYGIYIYSYAENYNEGKQYAEFTKKMIEKYGLNPTLGIYLDIEWNKVVSYMNTQQYTDVVNGFMSVLPHAKIYANLNYANGVLNTPYLRSYITWIAQWNNTCSYTGYYKMWQFTSDGSIPGINGRVDLNYYYLD